MDPLLLEFPSHVLKLKVSVYTIYHKDEVHMGVVSNWDCLNLGVAPHIYRKQRTGKEPEKRLKNDFSAVTNAAAKPTCPQCVGLISSCSAVAIASEPWTFFCVARQT
jgi:hypothetical protein